MLSSLQYLMSMFFLIVRGRVSVFAASLFIHPIDKRGMRIVESKRFLIRRKGTDKESSGKGSRVAPIVSCTYARLSLGQTGES